MQYRTALASLKASYKFMVIDTGLYKLYFFLFFITVMSPFLTVLSPVSYSVCVSLPIFLFAVLFSSSPPSSMWSLRPTSELVWLLGAVPMLLETPLQICY